MLANISRRIVFLLGTVALLFVCAACQKKATLTTIEETPYLGLPRTMDQIFSFNTQQLRTLDGFDTLFNTWQSSPQMKPVMAALHDRVKFDPLQDVDTTILGVEQGADDPSDPLKHIVLIARGRFSDPVAKLETLRKWLGEEYLISPPAFKAGTHPSGDFPTYETKAQSQYSEKIHYDLNFSFPAPDLMVFAGSPALLSGTLDVIAGQGEGIAKDAFWKKMMTRLNLGSSLWGAGNINISEEFKQLTQLLPGASGLSKAKQFYYLFDFGGGYQAQLNIICGSIDDATDFAGAAKTLIEHLAPGLAALPNAPETGKLPGKLVVFNDLETCKITLPLKDDERKLLLSEWIKLAGTPAGLPLPSFLH